MLKKYIIRTLLFLTPVVMVYLGVEWIVRGLPSSPKVIASYLEDQATNIEIMVLGASQNQGAVNPEFMEKPTVNLASGHQDYREDLAILSQLHSQLPKLSTVVIPMTFRHLDLKHNPKESWKHSTLLYYYGVNAFERTTYFKDRLLFKSNPSFYVDRLQDHYLKKKLFKTNDYGFVLDKTNSIEQLPVAINNTENPKAVEINKKVLKELLEFCENNELQVVLLLTPATEAYRKERNPNLLARRNVYLKELQDSYTHLRVFTQEDVTYDLNEFRNHNHLNSAGAEKITKRLNEFLKQY